MTQAEILKILPSNPEKAIPRTKIIELSKLKACTANNCIQRLSDSGQILYKKAGKKYLYWKPDDGAAWRVIPGHESYEVSDRGDVRHVGKARLLKKIRSHNGHLFFWDSMGSTCARVWIHRAVLKAFAEEGAPGEIVRHLDGNPWNNCLENLAWGSQKQNMADKLQHGTLIRGEAVAVSKLSRMDVLRIRELYGRGKTISALSRQFLVTRKAVRDVVTGSTWKHVSELKMEA